MRHNLAAFDAATGTVDPGWKSNTNGPVLALAATGHSVEGMPMDNVALFTR